MTRVDKVVREIWRERSKGIQAMQAIQRVAKKLNVRVEDVKVVAVTYIAEYARRWMW
jgi:hypothetical protein